MPSKALDMATPPVVPAAGRLLRAFGLLEGSGNISSSPFYGAGRSLVGAPSRNRQLGERPRGAVHLLNGLGSEAGEAAVGVAEAVQRHAHPVHDRQVQAGNLP